MPPIEDELAAAHVSEGIASKIPEYFEWLRNKEGALKIPPNAAAAPIVEPFRGPLLVPKAEPEPAPAAGFIPTDPTLPPGVPASPKFVRGFHDAANGIPLAAGQSIEYQRGHAEGTAMAAAAPPARVVAPARVHVEDPAPTPTLPAGTYKEMAPPGGFDEAFQWFQEQTKAAREAHEAPAAASRAAEPLKLAPALRDVSADIHAWVRFAELAVDIGETENAGVIEFASAAYDRMMEDIRGCDG